MEGVDAECALRDCDHVLVLVGVEEERAHVAHLHARQHRAGQALVGQGSSVLAGDLNGRRALPEMRSGDAITAHIANCVRLCFSVTRTFICHGRRAGVNRRCEQTVLAPPRSTS